MISRCRRLKSARARCEKLPLNGFVNLFKNLIQIPRKISKTSRNRIFTARRTFWVFLFQVISPDTSCGSALVAALAFWNISKSVSLNTCAYCKARIRFSKKALLEIFSRLVKKSIKQVDPKRLWYGRHVKIIDGTDSKMPDTPQNQSRYPQPRSQDPGCGFPKMKIVAAFSLINGIILCWKTGAYRESERSLLKKMAENFKKGDVLLADRGFSGYADFAWFMSMGLDFVIRINEKNRKHFQIVKKFHKKDRIVIWKKPRQRPNWMEIELWKTMPKSIQLRLVTYHVSSPEFRSKTVTVATTLMNPREVPTEAFAELYLKRWRAELYFKDIKETMNMESLSCRSPEMVEKEVAMFFLAYNLIRLKIYESAVEYNMEFERISFKRSMEAIIYFSLAASSVPREKKLKQLPSVIAQLKNPDRPGRSEPRAVKTRPKRHQYLTKPRKQFHEDPHRGKKKKYSLS